MPKQVPSTTPGSAADAAGATTPHALDGLRYEDALAELEGLVQAMESSQLPLDRLLESYQRGASLLKVCRERLDAVEEQVKMLDREQLRSWESEA
jgi:exodeoxyribonuclease VII small subunit